MEKKVASNTSNSAKEWVSIPCCQIEKWFLVRILLCIECTVVITLIGLLAMYATMNQSQWEKYEEATTCKLTYTDHPKITSDMIFQWANENQWPFEIPIYNEDHKACVCKGPYLEEGEPNKIKDSDEVPVWLAPGDIVDLYRDNNHYVDKLPDDFEKNHENEFEQSTHVKVCMPYSMLVALWNPSNASIQAHCHTRVNGTIVPINLGGANSAPKPKRKTYTKLYVGWDGVLYCQNDCGRCGGWRRISYDYEDERYG